MDGAIVGWLVYGNCLYYSKSNDCDKHEATAGANTFMFLLIIFGYLTMLGYLMVILVLPFLIYSVNQSRRNQEGGGYVPAQRIPSIL